jgi:hypothetical protein
LALYFLYFSTFKTNTSYYIFFDSDDYDDYWWGWGGSTDRAKLKSPKIDGNLAQCLEFWYHMNGIKNLI